MALIGYARMSKADDSNAADRQRDALREVGVADGQLYQDTTAGKLDGQPGLEACLLALQKGDTLVVWKLDRLGRSLRDLIGVVNGLAARGVSLKVLTGQGAIVDTASPSGPLALGIFAALAEFEHELRVERGKTGMAAARARGRNGGRPYKMTAAKLRMAMSAMGQRETNVSELSRELGVTRQTLYRHVAPDGSLRADGQKLLDGSGQAE